MRASQVVQTNPYFPRFDHPEVIPILNQLCMSFCSDLSEHPVEWEVRDIPEAGTFYWCPKPDGKMRRVFHPLTGYKSEVTCDALGVIGTLYFLSHLSFRVGHEGLIPLAQAMSTMYHRLRNEVFNDKHPHPEHQVIYEVID